jgi:putative SOS response-associated peptidase YedK
MCGRYSIFTPVPEMERALSATADRTFEPRYNAAPSQDLPVVLDTDPDQITAATWGFDGPNGRVINARAETLDEQPLFRDAARGAGEDAGNVLAAGRCLVPADGFYEWVGEGGSKRPYRVTVDDGLFVMAGLYRRYVPETRQASLSDLSGPDPVTEFTVVTCEPNAVVADLHDRMSAVLLDGADRWLRDGDRDLLGPAPADATAAYPVSTAVNDPGNDSPALIQPAGE